MFKNAFEFERPAHPGEILREDYLPLLGLTDAELAKRVGISTSVLTDIMAERRPITSDLATRLGTRLGLGARYWIGLQNQFDLWLATVSSANLARREDTSAAFAV